MENGLYSMEEVHHQRHLNRVPDDSPFYAGAFKRAFKRAREQDKIEAMRKAVDSAHFRLSV